MSRHRYSETLRRIAPIIATHRHGPDILRIVAAHEREQDPYDKDATNFDTAETLYWIGADWHGGQACELYAMLCATEYEPGPLRIGPDDPSLYNTIAKVLS